MKGMKALFLAAAVAVASPLAVSAVGTGAGANGGYNLLSEPDGVCHCGAFREKEDYITLMQEVCPLHDISCKKYYRFQVRTYHYCPNPICGDSYFEIGPWIYTHNK